MPVPQSVDFILYRNDPNAPMTMFAPQKYRADELAWSVSAEVDALGQHLKNFDVSGQMSDQAAYAAALQGVARVGYWRFSATGIARDLNYVVRNVPGFVPFETMPKDAQTDPEIFGALAADYYISSLRLTPGLGGGIQLPSDFRSEFTDGGVPASAHGRRSLSRAQRVDPPARRAADPDLPGATQPPLEHLRHHLRGRRLGPVHP